MLNGFLTRASLSLEIVRREQFIRSVQQRTKADESRITTELALVSPHAIDIDE